MSDGLQWKKTRLSELAVGDLYLYNPPPASESVESFSALQLWIKTKSAEPGCEPDVVYKLESAPFPPPVQGKDAKCFLCESPLDPDNHFVKILEDKPLYSCLECCHVLPPNPLVISRHNREFEEENEKLRGEINEIRDKLEKAFRKIERFLDAYEICEAPEIIDSREYDHGGKKPVVKLYHDGTLYWQPKKNPDQSDKDTDRGTSISNRTPLV